MFQNSRYITIGGRKIGAGEPPYCIAEVGINHNGDVEMAKAMISAAQAAGADAVKFQTFDAEEFCGDPAQMFTYRSQGQEVTESMLEMFKRYQFTEEQWRTIKKYCDSIGIIFFSTPQNITDLKMLLNIGVPAIKIGSDDFSNIPLLKEYALVDLPLILSCGMSDLAEVHNALEAVGWFTGKNVALMLCTSQYPTPPEDVNILKIQTLLNAFPGLTVGFSDHTIGPLAASLATALGATVFEKHFTMGHNLPGPDHWFSDEPDMLRDWITNIHSAHVMRGSPFVRPTIKEMDMRLIARRSIVCLRDIQPGELLSSENIGAKRPGGGISPSMTDKLIGLRANRLLKSGEQLNFGDLMK